MPWYCLRRLNNWCMAQDRICIIGAQPGFISTLMLLYTTTHPLYGCAVFCIVHYVPLSQVLTCITTSNSYMPNLIQHRSNQGVAKARFSCISPHVSSYTWILRISDDTCPSNLLSIINLIDGNNDKVQVLWLWQHIGSHIRLAHSQQ